MGIWCQSLAGLFFLYQGLESPASADTVQAEQVWWKPEHHKCRAVFGFGLYKSDIVDLSLSICRNLVLVSLHMDIFSEIWSGFFFKGHLASWNRKNTCCLRTFLLYSCISWIKISDLGIVYSRHKSLCYCAADSLWQPTVNFMSVYSETVIYIWPVYNLLSASLSWFHVDIWRDAVVCCFAKPQSCYSHISGDQL